MVDLSQMQADSFNSTSKMHQIDLLRMPSSHKSNKTISRISTKVSKCKEKLSRLNIPSTRANGPKSDEMSPLSNMSSSKRNKPKVIHLSSTKKNDSGHSDLVLDNATIKGKSIVCI